MEGFAVDAEGFAGHKLSQICKHSGVDNAAFCFLFTYNLAVNEASVDIAITTLFESLISEIYTTTMKC